MSQFERDLAALEHFPEENDTLPVSSVVKTLDEQIRDLESAPRDKTVFSIDDDEDEEAEEEEEEEEEEGPGGFSMPTVGLLSELKVSTSSGAVQFFATPVFDGKEQPVSSNSGSSLSSVALSSQPVDVVVHEDHLARPQASAQYSHTQQPSVERRAALEAAIMAITQDNFPDTDALRASLFELGRVPPELRLPVLSLLLTGSVSLDHEASTFSNPGHLLSITSTNALSRDCDDAVAANSLGGRGDCEAEAEAESLLLTDPVEARRSMFDLISLLCCRRQVEYHPLYLALLAPLLVSPQTPPRPLLSAAFYTLTTQFVPVLSLPPGEAAVRHVEHTHALLRLLVLYHSPRVVAHLDRVAWGWEGSLGDDKAAALLEQEARDAAPASGGERVLSHIDQLEAELGLDTDDMPLTPSSAPEPERGPPSEPSGLVPFHLIAGLFATCLPPPQAAMVIDWAVLLREPYAGVYLLAALLDIHTPLMLSLDRLGVERWFRGLSSGWDWALLSGRPHGGAASDEEGQEQGPLPSRTAATAAWILAASSLRRATPAAFVAALQAGAGSGSLAGSVSPLSEQGAEEDDNRDSFLESGQAVPSSLGISNHSSSTRTRGLPTTSATSAEPSSRAGGQSVWTAVEEALPCLCSNVRRTLLPQPPRGVFQRFIAQAVAGAAQGAPEGSGAEAEGAAPEEAVPLLLQYLSHLDAHPSSAPDVPVFFGLDARLESERAGGSFPKSLSLRIPDSFGSGSAEGGGDRASLQAHLASLVDELLPLCQAGVHLVLVAAGEGAVLRSLRELEAQKRRGFFGRLIGRRGDEGATLAIDLSSLSSAQKAHYRAYSARIEAILHYLCIERGLPHVSVMAGGFYEAVRVVWEAERVGGAWRAGAQAGAGGGAPLSPPMAGAGTGAGGGVALTLRGCLVDADLAVLEDMLEVGGPGPGAADARSAGVGSLPSSGETDAAAFGAGNGGSSSSSTGGGDGGGGREAWRGLQRFSSVVGESLKKAGSTIGSAASSSGARLSSSIAGRGGSSSAAVDAAAPSEPPSASTDLPAASSGPDRRPTLPLPSLSMPQIALPSMPSGMAKIGSWFRSSTTSAASGAQDQHHQSRADKGPPEPLPSDDGFGPQDSDPLAAAGAEGEAGAAAAERALALHRVHGARKGDRLLLTRAALPGAYVFSALKEKPSPSSQAAAPSGEAAKAAGAAQDDDSDGEEDGEPGQPRDGEGEEGSLTASYLAMLGATAGVAPPDLDVPPPTPLLPRLLVVTRERLLVLAAPLGSDDALPLLGSEYVVKSNHHLSELVKIAFKKRDPDLVTLFLLSSLTEVVEAPGGDGAPVGGAGQTRFMKYRIARKGDFVAVLQHNMQRFKG